MLKFIFFIVVTVLSPFSWKALQALFLSLSAVFGMFFMNPSFTHTLGYNLALDPLSSSLILLSVWITALLGPSSQKIKNGNYMASLFMVMIILLFFSLIMTFSCLDYLLMYLCFECTLIPMVILIVGWGYQPERLQAGTYLLFYTLFASFPLLVSLTSVYSELSSANMILPLQSQTSHIWYLCTIVAFLVKLPMFMVHLWLPKAHVQASVAGSMVLASILLKLGGYGLFRLLPLFYNISQSWTGLWISFGTLGGSIVSLICLRQTDMKALIAYSSIAHMGLVLSSVMLMTKWGFHGAVVTMFGHGLCSSGLFYLAYLTYNQMKTRSLLIIKGMLTLMPTLTMWWFLLSISNMAAPPSLNLLGEISVMLSVISWSVMAFPVLGVLSFLSASYTLFLFSASQHGSFTLHIQAAQTTKTQEFLILTLHWFPLNSVILKSTIFLI